MIGSYVLLIEVEKKFRKRVGSIGVINFRKGWYCYVGSAMGKAVSIENRISRHIKKRKKIKWHVDYLLSSKNVKIRGIFIVPSKIRLEERISSLIGYFADDTIENFGSSDCRTKGNLHYFNSKKRAEKTIEEVLLRIKR